MDPFRRPGAVPPPPPEPPPPPPPPPEPAGQLLLRAHRRRFLVVTIAFCLGLSAMIVPFSLIFVIASLGSGGPESVIAAVVAELAHASLFVVAPRLGWDSACRQARELAWGADLPGWIAGQGPPRWPLWTIPISMLLSAMIALYGLGLLGRLAYVIAWIIWCAVVSREAALLRWAKNEGGERVLLLEALDASRHARLEGVDLHSGEIHLLDRGQHVTWRAITPIDTLARDVKKSALHGL